jgi:hypothetical protein
MLMRVSAILVAIAAVRAMFGQYGTMARRVAVAGTVAGIAVVTILAVLNARRERALRRHVAGLALDEQLQAITDDPELRDVAAGDVFGNERRDWVWTFAKWLGPWLALLYLPMLYLLVPVSEHDGRLLLGLCVPGVIIWSTWWRRYVRFYKCPTCGERLPAVSLRPVRYVCGACATTWRL